MRTPDSVTVVWRTGLSSPSDSRVQYGTNATNLNLAQTSTAIVPRSNLSVKDHIVTITRFTPNTKYFYRVGTTSGGAEGGGTRDHFFVTAPPVGSRTRFRIWFSGDSGTGATRQTAVFNAMLSHTASDPPDIAVMLGDNAYASGTDLEHTNNHFAMYRSLLRNTVEWPCIGNHEVRSSDSPTQTGPYFEAFVLPTAESGTEAYYSFDYANVHFAVLDSADTSIRPGSPQLRWFAADLVATTQDWLIVYFHHPPYSKGSHNSDDPGDSGGRLVAMRENVMPIAEAAGVDIVLAGHSHIYERSFLIDQAYGYGNATPRFSTLLANGNILDNGDGQVDGDGAYTKSTGLNANDGAVYVVAGHSGRATSGSADHPVMFFSELVAGSCIMTVDNNVLNFENIRSTGVVSDSFTLVKQAPCATDAECGDGLFCNGVETCLAGNCESGIPPCDDRVSCTDDVCIEASDACRSTPNDANCDDGNVCTDELCDAARGCVTRNNTATCDNGDSCSGDRCLAGTCNPVPCSEPFSVLVANVFDNKNNKNYFPRGPDGSDPYDDLRTTAEELKVEILGDDPSYYWEATYDRVGPGEVTDVEVLLALRAETDAEGTVRIEVFSAGRLLTTQAVASSSLVNLDNPSVPPSRIVVVVPVDGEDVAVVNNLRVRVFQTMPSNAKKVFWGYTELSGSVGVPESTTCSINADCDDGLSCNGVEVCNGGECAPGIPINCDDGVACTDDVCDEATNTCDNIPNNSACDDGNACTDEVCDSIRGCTYTNLTGSCDNGDSCPGDVCVDGVCELVSCGESFSLLVSSVFDNKNNKTFVPGGPDGSEPYNDLRTMAEEKLLAIVSDDAMFYWESDYDDISTGSTVSNVEVVLRMRREQDAAGTLRIEVYSGGVLEEIRDVAFSTLVDTEASGPPTEIILAIPSLNGQPASAVDAMQVRVRVMFGNGKLVFWSYTQLNGMAN